MISFLKSFKFAFSGIYHLVKTERNFKIQLVAFIIILIAGFYFNITLSEWLVVLIISAVVLSLEAMNTALEKLCNLYSTNQDSRIKAIKDIAAGSVLIASIIALIIAAVIFVKYF